MTAEYSVANDVPKRQAVKHVCEIVLYGGVAVLLFQTDGKYPMRS